MVEIGGAQSLIRPMTYRKIPARRRKPSFAIAEEEFNLVCAPTIGDHVGLAVSVEIRDRDSMGMWPGMHIDGRAWRLTKTSFAVAEENREIWGLVIRNDKVEIAVAVHVGDADVVGKMPGRKR
jgi:hypothetical protein